ncbi:probable splicing factor, arginine/serine-rich 4 [Durio zibethinus]|uniref:Probable splicing factor, arginine/serine-rich 4 n=1 Tax=Durio zibethinus TaxID=66656 RepID=A0A6P5Y5Q7_DURZI|nr:probable splicing factor, arginine/serine-rich 4 [Durio zibethinus]
MEEKASIYLVDNIHPIGREGELRELILQYERVLDYYIPLHRKQTRHSKFGFFRFKNLREVLAVIRALNGTIWHGWRLIVNLAKYERGARNNAGTKVASKHGRWKSAAPNQSSSGKNKPPYAEIVKATSAETMRQKASKREKGDLKIRTKKIETKEEMMGMLEDGKVWLSEWFF